METADSVDSAPNFVHRSALQVAIVHQIAMLSCVNFSSRGKHSHKSTRPNAVNLLLQRIARAH